MLVSVGGGLGFGWFWLQRELAPLVEKELTKTFNRPVKVETLKSFYLGRLRFGSLEIPATQTDPDKAFVEAVDVTFNPLQLLIERTLKLDITLIQANIYLEENEKSGWVSTEIAAAGKGKGIKIDLHRIRLKNAKVELVGRANTGNLKTPVKAIFNSGETLFLNNPETIEFKLAGKLLTGGNLKVWGEFLPTSKQINVAVAGNEIEAVNVSNLVELPLKLQAGKVGTKKLEIKLTEGQVTSLIGKVALQDVTARLLELPQSFAKTNGNLNFQGSQIEFLEVTAIFGTIPAIANGTIDLQAGFDLQAKTEPVEVQQVIEAFKLPKLPGPILGKIQADIQVTGEITNPQVNIEALNRESIKLGKVPFSSVSASLEEKNGTLWLKKFQAIPAAGGTITAKGEIQLQKNKDFQIEIEATEVSGDAIALNYNLSLPFDLGLISGQTTISGSIADKVNNLRTTGIANLQVAGGSVTFSNFQIAAGRWQGDLQVAGVQLSKLNTVNSLGDKAEGRGQRVEGQSIAESLNSSPSTFASFDALFNLSGSIYSLQPQTIDATGEANLNIAGGKVTTEQLELRDGRWVASLQTQGIQLKKLFPEFASQLKEPVSGKLNLAGSVTDYNLQEISASASGRLFLAGGKISLENIQLANGNFAAVVVPRKINLSNFSVGGQSSQLLRGSLNGRLNLAGNLNNLNPRGIQLNGELNFSQGLALIERPLTTAINWNGQRLQIQRAIARNFNAKGYVDLNLRSGEPAIGEFAFNINGQELNLKFLPSILPPRFATLPLEGQLDFNGAIAGTLKTPQVNAQLALHNAKFGILALEPVLAGTVKVIPKQGVNLQLVGTNDRFEVTLASNYQPLSLLIRLDDTNINGYRQGEMLLVDVKSFPTSIVRNLVPVTGISLPVAIMAQPLRGKLSGNFALNLTTFAIYGNEVAIANPAFGTLFGDQITANFQYSEGQFILNKGQFQQDQSKYLFEVSLVPTTDGPQYQLSLEVVTGQIENLLAAAQIVEISSLVNGLTLTSYGTAADLFDDSSADNCPSIPASECPLFELGSPEAPILLRLRRLAEVQAMLALQQSLKEDASIPPLSELEGSFDGTLTIAGSPKSGIEAEFDFQGKQWQWGSYRIDRLIAKGNFQEGVLTLVPVNLQSDQSSLNFSGSFGGETPSGQLRIVNLPVPQIQKFVKLPNTIDLDGMLNATVTIGGTQENPQAIGELAIADATINQTAIQSTQGSFNYYNGRLELFASSILAEGAEPLTVSGSFPYKLPFAAVESDDDQFSLNVNLKDKGLTLLNILTRGQVAWVDGNGQVELGISGKFDQNQGRPSQLRAQGSANIENATIAVQFLPEAPLTEVNGKILFDFDHIEVESFKGNFSGGQILVAGSLPLVQTTPQDNPLTVSLRELTLNFKEFYQGSVRGDIEILGNALEPNITGELEVFDAQVLLSQAPGSSIQEENDDDRLGGAVDFNDLRIKLGKNVQILQPPIADFLATGTLTLNGSLNDLSPEGTIQLKRGQINLFTTRFRLAKNYENIARFSAKRGLDPLLDLQLVTSVVETTRIPLPSEFLPSEIRDVSAFDLGTIETVRVQAKVKGYASQLAESVKLSSVPPRSDREILGLIGGNIISTIGQGDATVGLATLASSAFSSSFQYLIADSLGLSGFSLFPKRVIDEERRQNNLDWAAAVSIDLSDRFSFSALKFLTNELPPQFGIGYRVNRNTVLRGSTDFSDDSRAVFEYQLRF
ncbi:MAG: translocation/assembly module TamB domain-containing protein [Prochloraceae cyanobacterium]